MWKMNRCTNKWIAILCTLCLTSSLVVGCSTVRNSDNANATDSNKSETTDQQKGEGKSNTQILNQYLASAQTAPDTWNDATATHIVLDKTTAKITGAGATANISEGGATIAEKLITISAPGTYVVTGTLTDGQLCIDAGDEDDVQLVLNETNITCSDNAPIYCANADELIITLAEGTENIITDGTSYTFQFSEEDEPDAAIFSHDDLIINGSGKLNVTGNYQKGIRSKDDLSITNGIIQVTSVDDGISGKDGLILCDGDFVIKSGEDALKSSNDKDADKGDLYIVGGTFTINAGDDAIHAEKNLIIDGGTINIESSKEALEGMTVTVNGGDINLVSSDDGINAAGTGLAEEDTGENTSENTGENMTPHNFTDSSDGTTAPSGERPTPPTFNDDTAASSGKRPTPPTSNDGTMATDGERLTPPTSNDSTAVPSGERPTSPDFSGGLPGGMGEATDYNYIRITDGNITIDAGGDGIDTNGNLYVDGGSVIVYGPTNNGNSPIDCAGSFEITGGTLIAAGSSGMAQAPTDSSTQASLLVYFDTEQKAGTAIALTDSTGDTIVTITPEKPYQCVLICAPDMTQGNSYTVKSDNTELFKITLETITTSVSQDGTTVQGGMHNMTPPSSPDKQSQ